MGPRTPTPRSCVAGNTLRRTRSSNFECAALDSCIEVSGYLALAHFELDLGLLPELFDHIQGFLEKGVAPGRVVGVLSVRGDHCFYWDDSLATEGRGIRCVPRRSSLCCAIGSKYSRKLFGKGALHARSVFFGVVFRILFTASTCPLA